MKPIITFEDDKQLIERGKYWQEVLGLSDWLIKFILVDKKDFYEENDTRAGENSTNYYQKTSVIKILKNPPVEHFCYFNQPQEQVLIHELLHCKFIGVLSEKASVESVLFENYNHTMIEDLSKSLFWAKYNYSLKDYYANEVDK
jgi:hypothetical protein